MEAAHLPGAALSLGPGAGDSPSPGGPGGVVGNTQAADAARFKRETRERLVAARENGLTMAKICSTANGAITEHQIMDILDAIQLPINVYRVLAAALDEIEKA